MREWPLSWRTAKDAVLARQPSSRHTPSHLTVWLVFQMGNCKRRGGHLPWTADGAPGLRTRPLKLLIKPVRSGGTGERGVRGEDREPLTLYSADTPLSVSRRELHGNWPVTLYKFTEKLGDNGQSFHPDTVTTTPTHKAAD